MAAAATVAAIVMVRLELTLLLLRSEMHAADCMLIHMCLRRREKKNEGLSSNNICKPFLIHLRRFDLNDDSCLNQLCYK